MVLPISAGILTNKDPDIFQCRYFGFGHIFTYHLRQ